MPLWGKEYVFNINLFLCSHFFLLLLYYYSPHSSSWLLGFHILVDPWLTQPVWLKGRTKATNSSSAFVSKDWESLDDCRACAGLSCTSPPPPPTHTDTLIQSSRQPTSPKTRIHQKSQTLTQHLSITHRGSCPSCVVQTSSTGGSGPRAPFEIASVN